MTTNGNGFDSLAQYARLSERVENQGKDIIDLRSNMNSGFQGVNTNIASLSNELRSNSKTQWPVIWAAAGVCFTVLVTIGAFFYGTLNKGLDRLDAAIVKNAEISQNAVTKLAETMQVGFKSITDNMVTQKEMEWRTARGAEDRKRTDDGFVDLRATTVSRNEWSERNHARDTEINELSRRIEELRQEFGSQYTARDVLLSTRSEVKDLRNQLRRLYESSGGRLSMSDPRETP